MMTEWIKLKIVSSTLLPIELLLLADPSKAKITHYLSDSLCFAAYRESLIVAACVTKFIADDKAEILNLATFSDYQKQGVGTRLLNFSIDQLVSRGVKEITLATGSFGHQLAFYQRAGFRVESVVKNYFLDCYAEPIFENGIQHKDMLRFSLQT